MKPGPPTRFPPPRGSLCASCALVREIVSDSGSRFLLCERARTDRRFRKYPPQPVVHCEGYEERERPAAELR